MAPRLPLLTHDDCERDDPATIRQIIASPTAERPRPRPNAARIAYAPSQANALLAELSFDERLDAGVPTFEDKVLQRAAAMALEAVHEQDLLDCSYGFRPQRSAHRALEAL